eukprot:g5180.t1
MNYSLLQRYVPKARNRLFAVCCIFALLPVVVILVLLSSSSRDIEDTFLSRRISPPTRLCENPTQAANNDFLQRQMPKPERLVSENGLLQVTLEMVMSTWPFPKLGSLPVRMYKLENSLRATIPGPTLVLQQGDKLRITLKNKLEENKKCETCDILNWFRKPNTTNIHVHGLHVSPMNSTVLGEEHMFGDNVLVAVEPGETAEYSYQIPDDHNIGSYWYHPHFHGSTGLQVGGGAAGMIIIQPKDTTTFQEKFPFLASVEETEIILSQWSFGGLAPYQEATSNANASEAIFIQKTLDHYLEWCQLHQIELLCEETDDPTSVIMRNVTHPKQTTQVDITPLSSCTPYLAGLCSANFILANGIASPILSLPYNKWRRLRLLEASYTDALILNFDANACETYIIAWDGVSLDKPRGPMTTPIMLVQGSRCDILIRCWQNTKVSSSIPVDMASEVNSFFGAGTSVYNYENVFEIVIDHQGDDTFKKNGMKTKPEQPSKDFNPSSPLPERAPYLVDMRDEDKIEITDRKEFVLQKAIVKFQDPPITRFEKAVAAWPNGQSTSGLKRLAEGKVSPDFLKKPLFMINNSLFNPDEIFHTMKLGGFGEWTIRSEVTIGESFRKKGVCGNVTDSQEDCNVNLGEQHPFHVHINHVQVISIAPESGKNIFSSFGMEIGDFRDSLPSPEGGSITVRTHYADFVGDVILHCHILFHEDLGMMKRLRIEE